VTSTYGDVDASADPDKALAEQRELATWPAIAAYKKRTYELLLGTAPVLDVGCGPGVDLSAIGASRSVGIDPSWTMCRAARTGAPMIARADAHALPFSDDSFGAARADRVLQHLREPHRALKELARIVRPGGRIVIADPDQESLVIQVPGVRPSTLERLKALRRDVGYRNGRLASELPALLRELRIDQVTIDAFPLLIQDPADAFGLPTWPASWQARAGFTTEELAEWNHAIEDAAERGFVYLVTFLVVGGTKK
jgi:SAM-dependent methyltransferase